MAYISKHIFFIVNKIKRLVFIFSKRDKQPRDKNGRRHGESLYYFDNGQLSYRCNHTHGVLHGLCESFNTKGKLVHYSNYRMGKRIGYWYYKNKKKYFLRLI